MGRWDRNHMITHHYIGEFTCQVNEFHKLNGVFFLPQNNFVRDESLFHLENGYLLEDPKFLIYANKFHLGYLK